MEGDDSSNSTHIRNPKSQVPQVPYPGDTLTVPNTENGTLTAPCPWFPTGMVTESKGPFRFSG
eukprot:1191575-Prorocentrum_minimum.AAC.3